MLAEVEEWWRKRAHEVSDWPRLVSPFPFISGPTEAFHSGLSGFSKFSEGRPPSLFSPPNFVVQRVDRQRAVRRRTRGGNRNWTAGSGHNHLHQPSPCTPASPPVVSALARTHTRVALCPVSRTQLGWVSAFNPLGGVRSLSRKACIHLRPRKAVGFVSGCNGLRTTTDQARTDGRTDGRMDWTDSSWLPPRPTYYSPHPPYHLPHPVCSPLSSSPTSWT